MRRILTLLLLLTTASSAFASDSAELEKLHGRAEGLIAVNDFRGAIRLYSGILLIEPDDAAAYADMGRCYMILGDFERAEAAFKNALHIDDKNITALEGLMRIHDPDMDRYFDEKTAVLPDVSPGFVDKTTAPEPKAAVPPPAIRAFASTPEPDARTQKRRRAQTALRNAGFFHGTINGYFGPDTKAAVQNFQMQNGLIPDGVIGTKTWKLLQEYA